MELTDRELALRWWNNRTNEEKNELAKQAKIEVTGRHFISLTGNEIEWIWKRQPHNS